MRNLLIPLIAALLLLGTVYEAWLTSDAGTVRSGRPPVLAPIAVVGGLVAGVVFFGSVEPASTGPALRAAAPRARPARPQPEARPVYNERKIREVMAGLREIPAKHTRKR